MGELYTGEGRVAPRSPWRNAFVIFLLLCFAGLQTATTIVDHAHEHGGPHSHCCPICHAGHVPAMQPTATVRIVAPETIQWSPCAERILLAAGTDVFLNSSRAPPPSVSAPRSFVLA